MNKSMLHAALLAAVVSAVAMAPAQAQSISREPGSHRDSAKPAATTKQVPLYPNATRAEPKQSGNPSLAKTMAEIYDLYTKKQFDKALPKAEAILADPKATAFDRAMAAYMASFMAPEPDGGDHAQALTYLERALQENGLNNNTHYQVMLQAADLLRVDDKEPQALVYIDRFLSETRSEDSKAYTIKANILYQMQRYPESVEAVKKAMAGNANPENNLVQLLLADYEEMDKPQEAVAVIEQLLAKTPNDKNLLQKMIGVYQQAGDDAKAGQTFDRMRAAGLIVDGKDYESAFRLLANINGRQNDAVALINEGLGKGLLTPSADLYAVLGQAYYDSDQLTKAIDAWQKGAPLSKDGEMYLNVAKLQRGENHLAEAKLAAHQAIAKGLKRPGEAWIEIGNAELTAGNKPAAIAAFREAAKYPETKKAAEVALRQAGVK